MEIPPLSTEKSITQSRCWGALDNRHTDNGRTNRQPDRRPGIV